MATIFLGYATRSQAARDVAVIVGEAMRDAGHRVETADLAQVPDLGRADLVVVGSGIQTGSWYPEATAWLKQHADGLAGTTVAVYNTCLNAADPAKRDEALGYNASAVELSDAIVHESFPGRYVPARVGFFQRLLLRAMRKPPVDHFDDAAVRAWAATLIARLSA